MGQAANRYVDPVYVENLFSTHLYDGTGANQTITNNIDLSGEGGLVWLKGRTDPGDGAGVPNHILFDTVRGDDKYLRTSNTQAQGSGFSSLFEFNSNGFTLGNNHSINYGSGSTKYVSWTFRKQPKFFDVVTWTGTGSAMTINHNLGQVPGMIIVKSTSATYDWAVWHREFTGSTDYIKLNSTAAKTNSAGVFGDGSNYLTPTSTQFFVGGNNQVSGEVGGGYVAYLFAHNNNDGGFGLTNDQDIIKCGSYTGNGSSTGPVIDLGFEPQWLLVKNASIYSNANWYILDVMRGWDVGGSGTGTINLRPNLEDVEQAMGLIDPNSTGFQVKTSGSFINGSGNSIIYVAIRRPQAIPTAASQVFDISTGTGTAPHFTASMDYVDFGIYRTAVTGSYNNYSSSRLTQDKILTLNDTSAELNGGGNFVFDHMKGWHERPSANTASYSWMWKRAPGYFDVVCYTGDGGVSTTVNHNLGVVPEMWWVKQRDGISHWPMQHKALKAINKQLYLHLNGTYGSSYGNFIDPTSTTIAVGGYGILGGTSNSNASGSEYIAYLFATAPGVSKVGSVTHSGSSTDVDCGFSSGARFVLLKRTDATGDWYIWDSVRGIVSGTDPYLLLNTTAAEVTNTDYIDPLSSGFTITSSLTAGDYIFYAVA